MPSRLPSRLVCLIVAALPALVWACALPAPDGPLPVGQQRFELADTTRRGVAGEAPDAVRTLPVVAWYPAAQAAPLRPYLPQDEAVRLLPALARNLGYAVDDTHAIAVCTAAGAGTGVAPRPDGGFPLVVLSHGFFLYPAQNTALAQSLASHGYVVVALGHPGDAVDLALADGRVVPTDMTAEAPALLEWRRRFHAADDHATRTTLIGGYAQALAGSRLGASQATWREDVLFAVRALQAGHVPPAFAPVLAATDPQRLAITGMSFGGSTAATACQRLPSCRAAVSLDGLNFDPGLYDADLGRPLLALASDWVRFPLYDGTPADAAFHHNDYAYERWTQVGLTPDVIRLRVPGTRHMAFSDLPLLMTEPVHEAHFGDADAAATARGVAAVTRAFLARHLEAAPAADLDAAIEAAGFARHDPAQTRDWARSRARTGPPGG
ncbi:hypothetical protein [Luteimonas sp. TWI1416]|uniref:alpha/beta hydrolase n=1 Tax=unclassified Luteimonas TaxID=2629088 RepID=UPI003207BF3A